MSSPTDELRIWRWTVERSVFLAYCLSILYNVAFFTQFIATPYIVKGLGISDTDYGYLQTVFGVVQLIGGTVFGWLTGRIGIRGSLFVCYGSTMLSAALLFIAQDFNSLVLSRLPCFFMHGQQGHQTLLSRLTRPGKERTNAFGRMGLTFGIGFILSPLLSVSTSKLLGERAPIAAAALLSILPFFVLQMIKEESFKTEEEGEKKEQHLTVSAAVSLLKRPAILNVLVKKNAPIAPMLLFFGIMQMHMIEQFAVSPEINSMIQMLVGICIMASNGFGVIWLRSRFGEQTLLFVGMGAFVLAFVQLLLWYHLWQIVLIMPAVSFGMSLVATVADSMMTSLVEEHEQGMVLGVSTAINSFVRTFTPAAAGWILENKGFQFFGLIGLIGSILGAVLCVVAPVDESLLRKEKEHKEEEKEQAEQKKEL